MCDSHVRLFLLPKEEDAEILHQRHEHVGDVLQHLGTFEQGIEQLSLGINELGGHESSDHATADGCELGFVAAVVGGAEEQDCERRDVDGMYVLNGLAGAARRIRHCLETCQSVVSRWQTLLSYAFHNNAAE